MELLLDRTQLHLWVKDSFVFVSRGINKHCIFQKENYVLFRLVDIKSLYGRCQIVGKILLINDVVETFQLFGLSSIWGRSLVSIP